MKKTKVQRVGTAARRGLALLLAASALTASALYSAHEFPVSAGAFALALMKQELGPLGARTASSGFSLLTGLAVGDSALLLANRGAIETLQNGTVPEGGDSELHEGTIIDPGDGTASAPETAPVPVGADNGVPARTIHPTNPQGYLVWKDVYITNTSKYTPDLEALMASRPAAVFTDEMPQVLILHTHATEAYTPPKGEEYEGWEGYRTEDTNYNVVRVGDEVANVFEEHGISVLHDRTLYDAYGYNDAYGRAETAIQAYLEKYPSIHFVLDIHRDAIEDSDGNSYKVLAQAEGRSAAQLSIVVGTDGGGLHHDHWQENLKLAVLLQQDVLEHYPTLMRPMYLRNSRYNEHATAGSLLIEVGAAGNSLDEALFSARIFAERAVAVFETLRGSEGE